MSYRGRGFALLLALVGVLALAPCAFADSMGAVSTDRFGYTGTVERYTTLADAQNQTNQVGTDIAIGTGPDSNHRDLALYIVNGLPAYDTDTNVIMGSWWYTTDPSGRDGYGNVTGNSGRGFAQLYDGDGSTDTATSFAFQNFDGTYWTEFAFSMTGANADYPNDYARFWVDYQGGGADKVVYHSYALDLVAGGLKGVETAPGFIESSNQPTSVTGTYSGIFQNVSTTYPENNGYYRFDLALDMTNWAWTNRDALTGDAFADSYFAANSPVPEPATLALFGLGAVAFGAARRRRS